MPKNNLIAPDKISNKTTQFKTLEFKMLKSVGIWKVVTLFNSYCDFFSWDSTRVLFCLGEEDVACRFV